MSVASLISGEFPGQSLYEILGVDVSSSAAALKKAYYGRALVCHPDKNGGDASATRRFQALSAAHAILSDSGRRAAYDSSGGDLEAAGVATEEGSGAASFADWYAHFRRLFPPVTADAVRAFEATYRGSAEETADVLRAYSACRGEMSAMLERVLCSRIEDAPRLATIVHAAVADGRLPAPPYAAFAAEFGATPADGASRKVSAAAARARGAREAAARREAGEAEDMLASLRAKYKKDTAARDAAGAAGAVAVAGAGAKRGAAPSADFGKGEPSLEDLLRLNAAKRASAFAGIAAKYGGKKGATKDDDDDEDCDDDDDDDTEDDDDDDDDTKMSSPSKRKAVAKKSKTASKKKGAAAPGARRK